METLAAPWESHPKAGTKIVAVTACPTGVALTYMAANRLTNAARQAGYAIKIETQGALGTENLLTRKDISRAVAVVFAADIEVGGEDRFAAHPILRVSTTEAIEDPGEVLARAIALASPGPE